MAVSQRKQEMSLSSSNKRRAIMVLESLTALCVKLSSCRTSQKEAPLPFTFDVFEAGHEAVLSDEYARELKDQLNENMVWTAPPTSRAKSNLRITSSTGTNLATS